MKIGVIGVGMVGGAISFGFRRIGHEVLQYDPKIEGAKFADVLPAELVFICVPTPSRFDGSCNTDEVEAVVGDLVHANYHGLMVIKSTVVPGTTDKLQREWPMARIAYCPEFLRERAAYSDFVEDNDVCIIGTRKDDAYDLVKTAHGSLPKAFARVTPLEAEMAKYFANTFHALRIVYANQFYDVCQAVGANYTEVKNAIVKKPTIGDYYLECNPGFRAFGGSCLPKDTQAFAQFVRSMAVDAPLFGQIVYLNARLG
jgi:UDPglucose 6-dehydrogenase